MIKKPTIDFHSNDWVAVRQRLLNEEEGLLQKLRDPRQSFEETQVTRGQLLLVRKALDWEKEPDMNSR